MESTGDMVKDMLRIPADSSLQDIVSSFNPDAKISDPDIKLELVRGFSGDKVNIISTEWKTNKGLGRFLKLSPEKEREILLTYRHQYGHGTSDPKTGEMIEKEVYGYETIVFKQEQGKAGTINTYMEKSRSFDEDVKTGEKSKPTEWPASHGSTDVLMDVILGNVRIIKRENSK